MSVSRPPLGGLSSRKFLRDYWQKRPLLVRQAIPGFAGVLNKKTLFALAGSADVESRLVQQRSRTKAWSVTRGPFRPRDLSGLPACNWTLLVNDVNLYSVEADALLQRFSFLSWSRLDDIMVSYAVDGGSVGAHADSYDVFLLQGPGRRRWRLMPPPASSCGFGMVEDAPLKLIRNFRSVEEMVLEPGDMLYLPPGWGHEGVALGTCQTYSIGFRTPAGAELSTAFLDYLHERGFADSSFSDAGRALASNPARIDSKMIDFAAKTLNQIRWNRRDVTEFLGRHLSEPKQHVVFSPPRHPLRQKEFLRDLASATIRLDPRTRLLVSGRRFFLNGTSVEVPVSGRSGLLALAGCRAIEGAALARGRAGELIYAWYLQGYLSLEHGS